MKDEIKLFNEKKVRTHWDEKLEKWCFSIVDVIVILTDSNNRFCEVHESRYNKSIKSRLIKIL